MRRSALLALACLALPAAGAPVITSGPAASPAEAFVGDTLRFTVAASDPDGLALSYRWRFGDSSAGPAYGPNPSAAYAYGAPGHYRASIFVRNAAGEFVNAFLPVTILTRPTPVAPTHSSTLILDTLSGRLWCANPDHGTVAALDAKAKTLLFEVRSGAGAATVARAKDGTIWAANRGAGTVTVHDGGDGHLLATIPMGYGSRPSGLVFDPAGTAAYVALEGAGRLARLDPIARSVAAQVELGPTPRAVAMSGDGARILVTRFISPEGHAEVWEVAAASFTKARTFKMDYDATPDTETGGGGVLNYLASIVISPDGTRALVSAVKANTRRGRRVSGVDLGPENTVRAALGYLDLTAAADAPGERNDFDNAAMPSASIYAPKGDLVFTALEGSNAAHTRDPYNRGAVLERNKDVGRAPIGLALDGRAKILYVQSFLDRSVSAWDVSPYNDRDAIAADSVVSRPLGIIPTSKYEPLAPEVLQGKRVFYDAADPRMSFNGYVSCAVCHLDGATDGRVWDFTDRGEGMRRTTSLLGRKGMGHGPVHWSANFDEIQDFENDIRGPFGGTGFLANADFAAGTRAKTLGDRKAGLSPSLDALAAYVTSLAQVNASPFRNADGTMTAEAAAGEAIFHSVEAGCARCHIPPLYTDSRLPVPVAKSSGDGLTPQGYTVHDVGTLDAAAGHRLGDTLIGFDTPTLKGIWETAPYLHDGRAATLMDVITTANPADKHGKTSHLTAAQRNQLVAFLRQLDDGKIPEAGIRPLARTAAGRIALQRIGASLRIGLEGFGPGARVRLLDARGRGIWTSPARPALAWDGRDDRGGRVPAGAYRLLVEDAAGARAAAPVPWLP